MLEGLHPVDLGIVLVYFACLLAIGYRCRGRQQSSADFISASKRMPWLAVLGSIVATEVSAATFLGTPGTGFATNLNYLQFGIGSFLARVFIAFCFLGAFYATSSLTIYAYLGERFGARTQTTTTVFFVVTRLLASGVRLMIATAGLHLILGIPFAACLAAFTAVAILYTGAGGIRTVIWTDLLQAVVFIASGLCVLLFLVSSLGLDTILTTGQAFGRFELFRFAPAGEGTHGWAEWLNDPQIFWIAVAFGFMSTAASFGTDQDTTQRVLTCKDVNAARRSMILSGCLSIPIAALFLFIGVGLFAYYETFPALELPMTTASDGSESVRADWVFPWFIRNELPVGLRGLLLTGVLAAAMSSLDSTMSALSSSSITDLYRPLLQRVHSDHTYLLLNRLFVGVFGVALALIAWALKDAEGFLWLTFKIGSITYGAMLGIFLLGTLTRAGHDHTNWIAILSSGLLCAVLLFLIESGRLPIGWTWLLLFGTAWTFATGWLLGRRRTRNP